MGVKPPQTLKALAGKSYGSIPHLPGSKRGPGDHGVDEAQTRRLTQKSVSGDTVIVQEKLDGSNVGVARINGGLIPVVRRGYHARSSPFEMHHLFADWVEKQAARFAWLAEGHRLCGEWLAQAHGTHYNLGDEPFVAFDLITGREKKDRFVRTPHEEFVATCRQTDIPTPFTFHIGNAIGIEGALRKLGQGGHGAVEKPEGAVWRLEVLGKPNLMAKFVRPDIEPGNLLPEISGSPAVWNWRPKKP